MFVKSPPTGARNGEPKPEAGAADPRELSRRDFLGWSAMAAAITALTPEFLLRQGWAQAPPGPPSLTADTINGLVAMIVPGPDNYSQHQGVSTPEPGGIAANATDPLIFTFNLVGLAPPPFHGFADLIAFVLNNVAQAVSPGVAGPFASSFANLSFGDKVAAFGAMESGAAGPELVPLAGILPVFVNFTVYCEAGVFDPSDGVPVARPVGWTLSSYEGAADGRDEFLGYYRNRRKADG